MIITIDPSGTSTTGIFCFWNWDKYEIISFSHEKWTKHVDFLVGLIDKHQPEYIAYENSNFLKGAVMNHHFRNLLKVVAGIEWICYEKGIKSKWIGSVFVEKINQNWGKKNKVGGLVYNNKKWSFKGQVLNEHEKDAILVFYLFYKSVLKNDWPFC